MNLHQIAGPMVAAVNPWVNGLWFKSTGFQQNASGRRAPTYAPATAVKVQAQALQFRDLVQINGLNIQGIRLAMYITGNVQGVNRADGTGGDLIKLPDGTFWLVGIVLENWNESAGWTKAGVTQQVVDP